MVTNRVVASVGAFPIDIESYQAVNGAVESAFAYRLRMDVPIQDGTETNLRGLEVQALLMNHQPEGYDIIWGMDFLVAFHITMVSGRFILSS